MTYDEMNNFILDYIKFDISGRAIMLSGEWGSGKSYYIKNTLKPFLVKKKKKCIIVSLYGLSDTTEISKAVFLELHPLIKKLSPAKSTAKVIGKTLLNAAGGKIGFDIESPNEESLKQLYESINLTGTLIILEDIERTQIEITKLLGYVNNLCENDRAKVLLITNENELLTTYDETDGEGKTVKHYTNSAIAYKRIKEKTVGDTIFFSCDYISAIQQIINSFGTYLNKYQNSEAAEDIRDIFILMQSANLRAFIYGCQKCRDLIEFISMNHISITDEIEKKIFYGIIAFTQRQGKGEELHFEARAYLSPSLGLDERYPLFRFCYNYIIEQTLSKDTITLETGYYKEYLKCGEWNSGRDEDLNIIKKFYIKKADEVMTALSHIAPKIKDGNIPYHDYGVIVNYIIAIKYDTGIDWNYNDIIESILKELRGITTPVDFEALFNSGYSLQTPEAQQAFEDIKTQMKKALERTEKDELTYTPESVIGYYKSNSKKLKKTITVQGFAHRLDVSQFVTMLEQCSSEQIQQIRFVFLGLYRDVKDRDYSLDMIEMDLPVLKELRNNIFESPRFNHFDPIQIMQIKMFINNLEEIIHSLNIKRNEKVHRRAVVAN